MAFDEVKALLVGVVAFFVTQGFKQLGSWMKKDLHGAAAFVVFVVSAAVVSGLDAAYAQIPSEYRELLAFVLKWAVALFGGSGVFRTYLSLKK